MFQLNDSSSTIKRLQLEHCCMLKEIIIRTKMINREDNGQNLRATPAKVVPEVRNLFSCFVRINKEKGEVRN